jgi:hypothetical protein
MEHEETKDNGQHGECQQKPTNWAFLIYGRVIWQVGDAPYSNRKADGRKDVRVFGKPESSARPKDEEPYGAESQKYAVQKLKSSRQLPEHHLPLGIDKA